MIISLAHTEVFELFIISKTRNSPFIQRKCLECFHFNSRSQFVFEMLTLGLISKEHLVEKVRNKLMEKYHEIDKVRPNVELLRQTSHLGRHKSSSTSGLSYRQGA